MGLSERPWQSFLCTSSTNASDPRPRASGPGLPSATAPLKSYDPAEQRRGRDFCRLRRAEIATREKVRVPPAPSLLVRHVERGADPAHDIGRRGCALTDHVLHLLPGHWRHFELQLGG